MMPDLDIQPETDGLADRHAALIDLLTDLETDDRACRIACLERLEGPSVAVALARLRRQNRYIKTDQGDQP